MSHRAASNLLVGALLALAALYGYWFHDDHHRVAALLVFALPPLALAALAPRQRHARFWAGVAALFWFSHGVMSAWSNPPTRILACLALVLALVVIAAASGPGLAARFGRRRPKG